MIIRTAEGWKTFGTLAIGDCVQLALQSLIRPIKHPMATATELERAKERVAFANSVSERVGIPYRLAVQLPGELVIQVHGYAEGETNLNCICGEVHSNL